MRNGHNIFYNYIVASRQLYFSDILQHFILRE
jgi:hypothetical protein